MFVKLDREKRAGRASFRKTMIFLLETIEPLSMIKTAAFESRWMVLVCQGRSIFPRLTIQIQFEPVFLRTIILFWIFKWSMPKILVVFPHHPGGNDPGAFSRSRSADNQEFNNQSLNTSLSRFDFLVKKKVLRVGELAVQQPIIECKSGSISVLWRKKPSRESVNEEFNNQSFYESANRGFNDQFNNFIFC